MPENIPYDDRPYRPGVGIILLNRDKRIFVGERIGYSDGWQMPQGGIDEGETPEIAALRELEEEIGTANARIIETMDEWLFYDVPLHTANKAWGGKYRGQKQKWIALEFLGTDDDIKLDAGPYPEFGQWMWVPPEKALDYIVHFKRDMYREVFAAFAHLMK